MQRMEILLYGNPKSADLKALIERLESTSIGYELIEDPTIIKERGVKKTPCMEINGQRIGLVDAYAWAVKVAAVL